MKIIRMQSNRSLSSSPYSRRQSSNDGRGGRIKPLGRKKRIQCCRSAPLVALRLDDNTATQSRRRSGFSELEGSSRNAEWNDIPLATPPLTFALIRKSRAKKVASPPSSPIHTEDPTKSVHFSEKDDLIEYEVCPQDLSNSWCATNILRTLENLDRISYHRGLRVSYPRAVHQGKECMVRMEPPLVIEEILRIREKHREAVLKEQARQVSSGKIDADALGKVALANSERGVEIASSSWWLERMNYRE